MNLEKKYNLNISEIIHFPELMHILEPHSPEAYFIWPYCQPHVLTTLLSVVIARAEALQYSNIYLPFDNELLSQITDHIGYFIKGLEHLSNMGTRQNYHPILRFPLLNPVQEESIEYKIADLEKIPKADKAVVLFSGGLDCTVAAYIMNHLGSELYLYHIKYGQSNRYQEDFCVKKTAENLQKEAKVNLEILETEIFTKIGGSALIQDSVEIAEKNLSDEYVPFRNTIFINFAVLYAMQNHIKTVVIGSHWDDLEAPDDNLSYFKMLQTFLNSQKATKDIKLEPILLRLGGKPEIISVGNQLGVDFQYSWSCHNFVSSKEASETAVACGKCGNCITRYNSFEKLKLKDPILYANKPPIRTKWYGWVEKSNELLKKLEISD